MTGRVLHLVLIGLSARLATSGGLPGIPESNLPVPSFIAFSVLKTAHQIGRGKVTFDTVLLNMGDGFNREENAFIAPESGIYHITFSGLNHGDALYIDLFKNDDYIMSVYESAHYFGHASNTAVLQLSAGDRLHLYMPDAEASAYGKPDETYTTFSGYLIVPIHEVTTYAGAFFSPLFGYNRNGENK